MGYQHLLDTAELKVELDRGERAEDNAFYSLKVKLQAQHIEQSVNPMQRFFHFLNEEDDVLVM